MDKEENTSAFNATQAIVFFRYSEAVELIKCLLECLEQGKVLNVSVEQSQIDDARKIISEVERLLAAIENLS